MLLKIVMFILAVAVMVLSPMFVKAQKDCPCKKSLLLKMTAATGYFIMGLLGIAASGTFTKFDKIMLSPGPGIPSEAGLLLDVIKRYAGVKPILGICLGEQAIGEVFGGTLVNLSDVFHGVQTPAHLVDSVKPHEVDYIFKGLHRDILVGRYHSWVVDAESLPECLEITCTSNEGQVMALRHKDFDIRGIQFHPESVLTPDGKKMINNWLLHIENKNTLSI